MFAMSSLLLYIKHAGHTPYDARVAGKQGVCSACLL